MGSPPTHLNTLTPETTTHQSIARADSGFDGNTEARELQMWIRALRSFFNLRNYPLPDAYRADVLTHDWTYELRIVRGVLLRCSQLVLYMIHLESSDETIFDEADAATALDEFSTTERMMSGNSSLEDDSLHRLTATFGDAFSLGESLLESQPVSLHVWTSFGETLKHSLAQYERPGRMSQLARGQASTKIPTRLLSIIQEGGKPAALGVEMAAILSQIFGLLEDLVYIERLLWRDEPLKQTLPIFTLIHERARSLVSLIKTRERGTIGLQPTFLETLDSTSYAITMELRKVFAHELVGISILRQAPAIYIKVETAHGLLSNCFRQSVIGLAHLFNDTIQGSELFDAFQTRLEQSLTLRSDLWGLLQLVRRAEKDSELDLTARLLKDLGSFYEGSLRYLMFKDWESCERFMEEIGAARDAAELAPVLHRFGAYLEALSNQVSMRAVLSNHPFDYPELELS